MGIPLKTDTLKLIMGLQDVAQLNTGCSPVTTCDILPEHVSILPSLKEGEVQTNISLENEIHSLPELHDIVSDAISIMTDDNVSRRDSIIEYNRSNKTSTDTFDDDAMDSDDSESEESEELIVGRHSKTKSHLIRRQSSAQWDKHEIEKLKDEMQDQLKFLQTSHTKSLSLEMENHSQSATMIIGNNESLKSQIFDETDSDKTESENGDRDVMSLGSTHNLLRPKSIDKWEQDEIDDETNGIREELVRLTSPTDASGNAYCVI